MELIPQHGRENEIVLLHLFVNPIFSALQLTKTGDDQILHPHKI